MARIKAGTAKIGCVSKETVRLLAQSVCYKDVLV